LAVEQHFYLLWPLVMLFIPQAALRWVPLGLISTGLFFRVTAGLAGWTDITIDVMTPGAFETLGMGAWLAFWQQNESWNPRQDRRLHLMGALGIVGSALIVLLPIHAFKENLALLFTELSRALFLGWLVAQALPGLPGLVGRSLQSGPARLIGQASFGIYLTHNFFLSVIPFWGWSIGPIPAHIVQSSSAFLATLTWAIGCYFLIERPFLRRT
jgi:peptidoglycan/LPS O-acetylase OafA/YrhL